MLYDIKIYSKYICERETGIFRWLLRLDSELSRRYFERFHSRDQWPVIAIARS